VQRLLEDKLKMSLLLPVGGAAILAFTSPALATNYNVSDADQLAAAIHSVNTTPGTNDTIIINPGSTIALNNDLETISNNVSIVGGNDVTIDGGGVHRGFQVGDGAAVTVNIQDVTIQNTVAQGGNGVDGGGGGAGLGGALFINNNANVIINNVTFDSNYAIGGNGGAVNPNNAGGGGGANANAATDISGDGGGASGIDNGHGADSEGATSPQDATGQNGADGGGGGGAYSDSDLSGLGDDASATSTGGTGGYGGGGGAAVAFAEAGQGGTAEAKAIGGDGGYGGGGGSATATTQIGDTGGGGEPTNTAGDGGYGGGDAGTGGGGGAGFGGAIFVREGGSLTIQGGTSIDGGSTTAGSGGGSGGAGLSAGSGIFLNGNNVTFDIGDDINAFVKNDIADSSDGGDDPETGAGGITKEGAGTLVVSGTNTYTGTTTINDGTLQQDGTTDSAFIVNYNLDGIGTINNSITVNAGGQVSGGSLVGDAPNPLGTLNANSITFDPNAYYGVTLDQNGSNSKLNLNGNADLGGASVFLGGDSTFSLGTSYNILHAGSLTNSFNPDVLTGLSTIQATLSQLNNQDVFLKITTQVSGIDGTINEENLADNLDDLSNNGSLPDDLNDLIIDLATQTGTSNSLAPLDPYLGDVYSAFDSLGYWQSNRFINRLVNHLNRDESNTNWARSFALNGENGLNGVGSQMAMLRQLVAAQPNPVAANSANGGMWGNGDSAARNSGVWGAIYGDRLNTDEDSALGSPDWSASNKGVALGYGISRDGVSYGLALGYHDANLDFSNRDADGDSDGWDFGLYAGRERNDWYVNGALTYNTNSNNLSRTDGLGEHKSDFNSNSIAAMVEVGKHYAIGDKESKVNTATPYLSLLAMHYSRDDISESGPGVGLNVDDASRNFLTTNLGARFDHKFVDDAGNNKGGVMAGLSWIHQFGDTDMPVNSQFQGAPIGSGTFRVYGTPLSKNALGLDLGGYGKLSENLLGFLNYHGSFGGNEKLHSITAGVEYVF